ncbi:MAG: ABC transporter permease [bacterium]
MRQTIAFWSIFRKDVKNYYLKPPNISWGIIFPLAWTLMFFIRSGGGFDLREILPGVMAMSILFGTTSLLSVTVTFEKKGRSFERLLLSPISLKGLMLAKTSGAILFGIVNAFVPVIMAFFIIDLGDMVWLPLIAGIVLTAIVSTFMGLFIAVAVAEVFEAQTFSNFFRFPMVFLCGLFFPIDRLPVFLRPFSYILPLTYGGDVIHGAINNSACLPLWLSITVLSVFCVGLFLLSIRNINKKWML